MIWSCTATRSHSTSEPTSAIRVISPWGSSTATVRHGWTVDGSSRTATPSSSGPDGAPPPNLVEPTSTTVSQYEPSTTSSGGRRGSHRKARATTPNVVVVIDPKPEAEAPRTPDGPHEIEDAAAQELETPADEGNEG